MDSILVQHMPRVPDMDAPNDTISSIQFKSSEAHDVNPQIPPKRPYKETSEHSTHGVSRHSSPACSDTSSALSSVMSMPNPTGHDGAVDQPAGTEAPPAKRRRLTPSEKLAREQEKAKKRQVKDEQRAKRDIERAEKEEQKKVRDEERRAKNEVVEEKKRERELKKQREDEKKARKDRAQSRVTTFFARPKPSPQSTPVKAASTLASLEEHQAADAPERTKSDYCRTFLPFEAPSNAILAPLNRFVWDDEAVQHAKHNAEEFFSGKSAQTQSLFQTLELSPFETAARGTALPSTSQLVDRVAGSEAHPVELNRETDPRMRLRRLPMKYIYFHQDVRPPYIGTMSRGESAAVTTRAARNPFRRSKPELDYDYDSEAEWEEPEEGEDLASEADEELESQGDADDLDDFLDDEEQNDPARSKFKSLANDMQPISSGLCWEDAAGRLLTASNLASNNLESLRLEPLLPSITIPLDPFSSLYWADLDRVAPLALPQVAPAVKKPVGRPPLHARPNTAVNGTGPSRAPSDSKTQRVLSGPELEAFVEAVNGSDLTKSGLLAVLKKRLPKVPNTVLSATLSTKAARIGLKEADKRWRLIQE